jgi:hypothetical protein
MSSRKRDWTLLFYAPLIGFLLVLLVVVVVVGPENVPRGIVTGPNAGEVQAVERYRETCVYLIERQHQQRAITPSEGTGARDK